MTLTNHPNRGTKNPAKSSPCRSPAPAEIVALRNELGLTQQASANMVCYSLRAWQNCEYGDRQMHPAAWQLYCLKTMNLPRPVHQSDAPGPAPTP